MMQISTWRGKKKHFPDLSEKPAEILWCQGSVLEKPKRAQEMLATTNCYRFGVVSWEICSSLFAPLWLLVDNSQYLRNTIGLILNQKVLTRQVQSEGAGWVSADQVPTHEWCTWVWWWGCWQSPMCQTQCCRFAILCASAVLEAQPLLGPWSKQSKFYIGCTLSLLFLMKVCIDFLQYPQQVTQKTCAVIVINWFIF